MLSEVIYQDPNTKIELLNADEMRLLYTEECYPKKHFPENILSVGQIITLGFQEIKWISNEWVPGEKDFIEVEIVKIPFNSEARLLRSSYIISNVKKDMIIQFNQQHIFN